MLVAEESGTVRIHVLPFPLGLWGKTWGISIRLQFYFQLQKGNQKKKCWGRVARMHAFFLKHCDGEFGKKKKRKEKGLEELVQMAWSQMCITCSYVGFHLITRNELFWVVVAFLFVLLFFSHKWLLICHLGAECCRRESCVLFVLTRHVSCMLCIWQDWSCKRWISMHLFWLPDKCYIVIIVCLFVSPGNGIKMKAL